MSNKGVIFYTDNELDPVIVEAGITSIFESKLPVWSCSLKPIDFGDNIVLEGKRGYPMMVDQIVNCLERAETDVVFFCEHDVLYNWSHFQFTPLREDTFYYNLNNWRWDYSKDRLIRYNGLTSLSQLCVNRNLALNQFRSRQKAIQGLPQEVFARNEPAQPRKWGYEPGTVTELIGNLLKQNGPLTKEEILEKILAKRFIK